MVINDSSKSTPRKYTNICRKITSIADDIVKDKIPIKCTFWNTLCDGQGTLDWNRDKNPSCSLRIMAPKGLGHLAAQERFHKPEVPTLTKSRYQREIVDTSQLLKTLELQDQKSDFNETHIALINYPCRPLQGGNTHWWNDRILYICNVSSVIGWEHAQP